MSRIMVAVVGLFVLAGSVPALAGNGGGASGDCEVARIKARAGGPTNEHDAWLLETCGCEPGAKNAYCEQLADRQKHEWLHQKLRSPRDY